jgi:hypothetical protein
VKENTLNIRYIRTFMPNGGEWHRIYIMILSLSIRNFNITVKNINVLKGCYNKLLPYILINDSHGVRRRKA